MQLFICEKKFKVTFKPVFEKESERCLAIRNNKIKNTL